MKAAEKKEFLYISVPLALLLILALYINLAPLSKGLSFTLGNRLRFLGFMSTLNVLFWSAYIISNYIFKNQGSEHNGWKRCYVFIENNSLPLLLIFIVLVISWFGFVIFRNPYLYMYNHGDAAFYPVST
jgi:hypothetical protein